MVTCRLCGKEYKSITPTHLRRAHGLSMAEYRERFPDAPIRRPVTNEIRSNYSKSASERWADPDFKAANAPKLASMSAEASAALQEKLKDGEFREQFCQAVSEGATRRWADREKTFCLGCGKPIHSDHSRCNDCWKAWRLENAMHLCKNPHRTVPVKGQTLHCSKTCMLLNPDYIESRRMAGRLSQEKHPENRGNLIMGNSEALNRPDVREKARKAVSAAMIGRPKPIAQRQRISKAVTQYWRNKGILGDSHNRNPGWPITQAFIRSRDRRCLKCGRTKGFMSFLVHHLNGLWWDDREINLATLCRRCHAIVTHGGHKWRPCRLP